MYILYLVDLRLGFEVPVSFNTDPMELIYMVDSERVHPYTDDGLMKSFQKNGQLEFSVPPKGDYHIEKEGIIWSSR